MTISKKKQEFRKVLGTSMKEGDLFTFWDPKGRGELIDLWECVWNRSNLVKYRSYNGGLKDVHVLVRGGIVWKLVTELNKL